MAKLSGELTLPAVELKTQNWYMAFQVIQVFLITTFASGAAAVVQDIINNPSSATTLLAQNLPLASNFYISYFILQSLGIAAGDLLNIGALVMFTVVGKFLDKSPRKMFNRYIKLSGQGWGSLYPKFGNLAIIGTSPLLHQRYPKLKCQSNNLFHHRSTCSRFRYSRFLVNLPRRALQLLLCPNQQH
jgi:hypothetical protein